MKKVSVSVADRHIDRLEERQENGEAESRSEALRELLDEYDTVRTECDRLRTEYEELRTECDRLQDQLAAVNSRHDDVTELVEYVELERTLEQRRAQAGVFTRAKWWVFGMDGEPTEV